MSGISWKTDVGVNHVGAYQVSGRPYATGSITVSGSTVATISFPQVTRWFQIIPHKETGAKEDLKVAFSENGLSGTEHFKLHAYTTHTYHPVYELKVSELYIKSDGGTQIEFDVIAGLTNISTDKLNTSSGTNWSGSSGVG
jgi:hypothetical protein